ncbi:MAG: HAD family hydrolase [Jiangellales bacterium]
MRERTRSHGPVTTAVLTNGTNEQQHAKLQAVGLQRRFSHVFTAESLGAAKPERSTYRDACEVLDVDVCHALHVGDQYALDEPARIHSLRELPRLLLSRE